MDKTITIGRIYFKLLIPHKQAVECPAFIPWAPLNSFVNEFRDREDAVVEDPAQDVGLAFFEGVDGGFDRLPARPAFADDHRRGLDGAGKLPRVLGRGDTVTVEQRRTCWVGGDRADIKRRTVERGKTFREVRRYPGMGKNQHAGNSG